MEHLIHLKGYRASHDEGGILKLGTKDSFGIETLKIDADEAWDGLIISATFVTSVGRTKMVMKSDNTIVVPPEATAADTRMTVNRIVFSGIKTQVQRITTDLPYEIDPHAPIDGDNSTPRTPDEYIQFVEEMKEEVRNANPVPDPTEEDDGKVPTVRGNQYVLETPQGGGGGSFDINTATPAFTEAETRENIQTGETIPVLFGKIKKFFTDLKTVAFTGKYSDLTGQPQALKNPNALTFTGGATGTYDGSSPLEIAIPSGGGSGTSAGFGTPTATASALEPGTQPTVEIQASGPDTAKIFAFTFGIPKGQDGADGKTPVKGVDYWTDEEQQQIVQEAAKAVPGQWTRVEKSAGDSTLELQPQVLYVWPEMTSLTITFAEPSDTNIPNEYHFFFTSGASPTTLSMTGVISDAYSIEANHKYEVSVLEGVAYVKGVPTA